MGLTHHSIAISDIQKVRSGMQVTCGPKGVVHDYVPFYFTKLSLMLLNVVNAKNVDQPYLIHLAVPIDLIDKPNVVFTDASANREGEPPNFFEDPDDLRHLLWNQIDANKWPRRDDEFKHEKMAEMLIHRTVPWTSISRIVVWNEESERRIRRALKGTVF